MGQTQLPKVSHCCTQGLLCKMPLWTLPAQDPRGRRLGEYVSQSWKQGLDAVFREHNRCPNSFFPLFHPHLSVQTSVLCTSAMISAPVPLSPDCYPSSCAMPLPQPLLCCRGLAGCRWLQPTCSWWIRWPLSAGPLAQHCCGGPLSCCRASSRDCVRDQTISPSRSVTQINCVLSGGPAVSHPQRLFFPSP